MDTGGNFFFFDFLEVELGKAVKPVGDLHHEEKLKYEWLRGVTRRITVPERREIPDVAFCDQNVDPPDQRDEIEDEELTGFVKLGMLEFRKMHLAIDFIQGVFLAHSVHDDGDEHVEEDGANVFDASTVKRRWNFVARLARRVHRHVVAHGHEQLRHRLGYLKHQSDDKEHGYTGDDIGVVLDDEFVAEDGRTLLSRLPDSAKRHDDDDDD